VRSLIAHILLSGVKRRRNAFGLTLAEGTTAFDGTGASLPFVREPYLDHCFREYYKESGCMLG
jgi:hypothetical protein